MNYLGAGQGKPIELADTIEDVTRNCGNGMSGLDRSTFFENTASECGVLWASLRRTVKEPRSVQTDTNRNGGIVTDGPRNAERFFYFNDLDSAFGLSTTNPSKKRSVCQIVPRSPWGDTMSNSQECGLRWALRTSNVCQIIH